MTTTHAPTSIDRRLAEELGVPLLAEVPMHPRVVEGGDTGRPIVAAEPNASAARALTALAERVVEALEGVPA